MAVNDSYTFLMKELEKVDDAILEPLSGTDWPRDMPVITGGGLLESIASVDVTYASSGGDDDNLFFEAANDIPVIQADLSKQVARTFNFAEYMSFSTMEREKMMQVGRDPETFLNKGIRLHCDKLIDRNVYTGFTKVSSTGLCNNPNIVRSSALPHTSGGTDTQWQYKTADEILDDINRAISSLWRDNDCSSDALPNHILIPVEQFGQLVTRKVGTTGDKSILTYIKENNIVTQQGKTLVIDPCKFCKGVGSDSSDRMVVYINEVEKIRYHQTVPLRRLNTEITNLSFKTPYVAPVSEVEFNYPTTVRYVDGI